MNEDNPYSPVDGGESITKSTTFELADLLIFTMISAMSFAWFPKSDPHELFPEWSFYAAGVLCAAFVTYWGWAARVSNPDSLQSFASKVVVVLIYMFPTWTIGHLTSLCIVYPTLLSTFVPTGLLLYARSVS